MRATIMPPSLGAGTVLFLAMFAVQSPILGVLMLASTLVLLSDTLPRADRLPDPRRFIRRVPVARKTS